MPRLLEPFRQVASELAALRATLQEAAQALIAIAPGVEEGRGLEARLDELERGRAMWEAEIEGQLVKAGAKFAASRAAEERSRHMLRRVEGEEPDEDDEGSELDNALEAYVRSMGPGHEGVRADAGVQPLRNGVGSRREVKAALRQAKRMS